MPRLIVISNSFSEEASYGTVEQIISWGEMSLSGNYSKSVLWRTFSWDVCGPISSPLWTYYRSEFQEATAKRRRILGREALGQAHYLQKHSFKDRAWHYRGRHPPILICAKREMLYCPIKPLLPVLTQNCTSCLKWYPKKLASSLLPVNEFRDISQVLWWFWTLRGNQDLKNQKPVCSRGFHSQTGGQATKTLLGSLDSVSWVRGTHPKWELSSYFSSLS